MEYINELFELTPVGTKHAGVVAGVDIYTNENIVKYVKDWVRLSAATKEISNKVIEGIDSNHILIGYLDSNLISYLVKKTARKIIRGISSFIGKPSMGNTFGFYSILDNKIVILLDHNSSFLGKAYYPIPFIIAHEMIHLIAHNNNKLYMDHSFSTLQKFYKAFIEFICTMIHDFEVYELKNTNALKELILKINAFELNQKEKSLKEVYDIWLEFCNKELNEEDSLTVVTCIFTGLYDGEYYKYILQPALYYAYLQAARITQLSTVPYQEIFAPSEVLCIINQMEPSNEIIDMIKAYNF